MKTNVML